jgi:hypothetical protein
MATRVDVPNVGVVEFPDSMDAAAIEAHIKSNQGQWGKDVGVLRQTISATAANPKPEIDYKTGAPWNVRTGASIKVTPAGKMNYLESVYGKGNVGTNAKGEAFFKSPTGMWTAVDESGLSLRDVTADLAGPAIETVPPVFAGMTTLNPAIIGGAGMIGRGLRQQQSAMLPGSDEMGLLQRASDIGASGLLTGLAQRGANALGSTADVVRPHNLIAQQARKAVVTPYAIKGARLEKQTGMQLTPGELTGNRGIKMAEGVARQHPVTADKVMQFDQEKLKQAVSKLDAIATGISGQPSGAISVGAKVKQHFDGALNAVLTARKNQARIDYGAVNALSQGKKIIPTESTASTLDDLIKQFDVPGGGDASAAIVNRLKSIKTELSPTPVQTQAGMIVGANGAPLTNTVTGGAQAKLTANQAQRLLQIYGDAAKGTGKIFTDIDSAQQRYIASRVFGALQNDLDSAATGLPDDVATALTRARTNYAKNSKPLEYIESTALGKLFGGDRVPPPEKIAESIFKMQPSEIRNAMPIIKNAMPDVKRYMIEHMVEKSIPAASQQTAGGVKFSPARFNTFFSQNESRFRTAFGRAEYAEIKRVSKALERVVDRAGMQGSQTAPFAVTWDMAKSVFSLNPVNMARGAGTIIYPKKIAHAMTTPQGRKALLTLTTTKPGTKAAVAATAYITADIARQEDFPISDTIRQ